MSVSGGPGLVARDPYALDLILAFDVARERSDHRYIQRAWWPAPPGARRDAAVAMWRA